MFYVSPMLKDGKIVKFGLAIPINKELPSAAIRQEYLQSALRKLYMYEKMEYAMECLAADEIECNVNDNLDNYFVSADEADLEGGV